MHIKASVALSRKWDAREAGREVAENLMNSLKENPKFVVLACTYEYFKNGGYKELLNGVWEVLPSETKLVGGVVSGFIIPQGCFSRGVAMLGAACDKMDVATGVGKFTKTMPKRAGRKAAESIKRQLENSRYKNGFVVEFTSGALLPQFHKMKITSKSKFVELITPFMISVLEILGWGLGREEMIMEAFSRVLHDFKIIGISTWDDKRFAYHREFLNDRVYNNSIVALGIKTDLNTYVNYAFGYKRTEKGFVVTKTDMRRRVIKEINNKPAKLEFLRILGWKEKHINERHLKRTIFVFPSFEKDGCIYPVIPTMFYGNSIVVSRKIKDPKLKIFTASGKSLLGAIDEAFQKFDKKPMLGIIAECAARQEALGAHLFEEKERIEQYMKGAPYFGLFSGGEYTYTPEDGSKFKYESFNVALITSPPSPFEYTEK